MKNRVILGGVNGWLLATVVVWWLFGSPVSAQRTKLTPVLTPATTTLPPSSTNTTSTPTNNSLNSSTPTSTPTNNLPNSSTPTKNTSPSPPIPIPTPTPTSTKSPTPQVSNPPTPPLPNPPTPPLPIPPPPPPPPPSTNKSEETPNNPLVSPEDIDKILSARMTSDEWMLMYQPLSCLDTSLECVQKLQLEAVQNSPVIKELETKIQEINAHIENAKTNNKKLIDLAIFEPGLQLFLKKDTVVENGQTRTIGFFERFGQLFTNPGTVLNDLLGAVGIPLLKGAYGGNDAQQSRAIQIGDLTVKVAEMERGKAEIANKTKEKVQQLVLDFDTAAREFQAEQAIVRSETRSFKIYAITYAAGDGDTNIYLSRKEQLERAKLKVFKDWAKLRAQISYLKNLVISREN